MQIEKRIQKYLHILNMQTSAFEHNYLVHCSPYNLLLSFVSAPINLCTYLHAHCIAKRLYSSKSYANKRELYEN